MLKAVFFIWLEMLEKYSVQIQYKYAQTIEINLHNMLALNQHQRGNDYIHKAKNIYGQNRLQLSTKIQQIMKPSQHICKTEKLCT